MKIAFEMQPATVRQVFYQATVRGLVDKTESSYDRVQRELAALRTSGAMPFGWIAYNTRWMRKPTTWDRMKDDVEDAARSYRRSLWANSGVYTEIWLEDELRVIATAEASEREHLRRWAGELKPGRDFDGAEDGR